MSYTSGNQNLVTSIFGRRLGLQLLSTNLSGASKVFEALIGPEAVRMGVTTGETTGTNLPPYGVSNMNGTSAGSSSVYVLDPPVPGFRKLLAFASSANGNAYVRTANSETIQTTFGSSFTTIKCTGNGIAELVAVTTAIWMALNITSGTTSNGAGMTMTTST